MRPATTGDFCFVTNKKLEKDGLKRGDEVIVAALKAGPASNKDMYLQRIFALVNSFEDGKLVLTKTLLIDPRSLDHVTEERKGELQALLEEQFKKD